jgi:hypothetical protein
VCPPACGGPVRRDGAHEGAWPMRTRHLSKTLTALVAAALMIGLLGLPAAANTATGQITSGTLTLRTADGATLKDFVFPPATPCTPSSATFSMSGTATSGSWQMTLFRNSGETIGAQNFRVTFQMPSPGAETLMGTYAASTLSGTSGTSGNAGTMRIVAIKSTTTDPCIPLMGAGNCTIEITKLIAAGVHDVTPPPTILPGDTATISGNNGPENDLGFEVSVPGTATNCGSLVTADDGSVVLTDIHFLAT